MQNRPQPAGMPGPNGTFLERYFDPEFKLSRGAQTEHTGAQSDAVGAIPRCGAVYGTRQEFFPTAAPGKRPSKIPKLEAGYEFW